MQGNVFFNYLLALIGGPTFYGFFLCTQTTLHETIKRRIRVNKSIIQIRLYSRDLSAARLVAVASPADVVAGNWSPCKKTSQNRTL